jgi:hypothetical protein
MISFCDETLDPTRNYFYNVPCLFESSTTYRVYSKEDFANPGGVEEIRLKICLKGGDDTPGGGWICLSVTVTEVHLMVGDTGHAYYMCVAFL